MSTRDDDIYSPLSAALQAFPDVHEPTPQHSSTQTAPVKSAKMKPRESDEPGNGKEDKKSAINRVNRKFPQSRVGWLLIFCQLQGLA